MSVDDAAEDDVVIEDDQTDQQTPEEDAEVNDDADADLDEGDDGEGDDGDADGKDTETTIVLDGEDGSQPKSPQKNLGVRKRIDKLNAKVEAKADEASAANDALAVERERNKLLQLAIDQKNQVQAPQIPDQLDYDDGASDPKYQAAFKEYTAGLVQEEIQRHVETQAKQPPVVDQSAIQRELHTHQTGHYDRAGKLGIENYDEIEDQAIEILGKDTVNQLIGSVANSEVVLYYLGKNPDKAEKVAELIKSNPVKGVLEIGRLSAKLKTQKGARKPAPNPDAKVSGGGAASKKKRGPAGATYD